MEKLQRYASNVSTALSVTMLILMGMYAWFVIHRAITEEEARCLAANIHYEAALEPRNGKRLVAFTVIARLQARTYFGRTICGVVLRQNEYSWTLEAGKTVARGQSLASPEAWRVAREFVAIRSDRAGLSRVALELGIPLDTHFYKRHDLNEHDPASRMSPDNRLFWRVCLEPIKTPAGDILRIGDHVPYRQKVANCRREMNRAREQSAPKKNGGVKK